MVKSMTAFARQQMHHEDTMLQWEIRSVNHRFLELSFSLPEPFRLLEPQLRQCAKQRLKRGKIDCTLHCPESYQISSKMELNQALLQRLSELHQQAKCYFPDSAGPTLNEILRWPQMLQANEDNQEGVRSAAVELFTKTIESLIEGRTAEGDKLGQLVEQRLDGMEQHLQPIKKLVPELVEHQQQRLRDRCQQVNLSLNSERLEQEMAIYAQKLDVSEEIERLETHIIAMHKVINQAAAVGRQLDFLLQEAQREVNTLASKSPNAQISHASVELKLLIEQMREQAQNIE